MKKIFGTLLFIMSISLISVYSVRATSTQVTAMTQSEDCETVGNVECRIIYNNPASLWVSATNYNNYPVTISYTIKATNGTSYWTVDSGVLRISAYSGQGSAPFKTGPSIYWDKKLSYSLVVEQPQYCK